MRGPLIIAILAIAAILSGCDSGSNDGEEAQQLEPSPTAAAPTAVAATSTATPAAATPAARILAPAATAAAPLKRREHHIVNTGGDGVALRDGCSDESRALDGAGRGFREGDNVTELRRGAGECAGWSLVESGDARESWVRLRYLSSSDTASWPGDVAAATWGTILEELEADERACVEAELTADEIATAREHALLDPSDARWVGIIGDCMTAARAGQIAQALNLEMLRALGIAQTESASCYRPFLDEQGAYDRGSLFMEDPPAAAFGIALEAIATCSGAALSALFVREAGLDPDEHPSATACVQQHLKRFFELIQENPDEAAAAVGYCILGGTLAGELADTGLELDEAEAGCLGLELADLDLNAARFDVRAGMRGAAEECLGITPLAATVGYAGDVTVLAPGDGVELEIPARAAAAGTKVTVTRVAPALVEWYMNQSWPPVRTPHAVWEISTPAPLEPPASLLIPEAELDGNADWLILRDTGDGWKWQLTELRDGVIAVEVPGAAAVSLHILEAEDE